MLTSVGVWSTVERVEGMEKNQFTCHVIKE